MSDKSFERADEKGPSKEPFGIDGPIRCILEYMEAGHIVKTDEAAFPNYAAVQVETRRSAVHLVQALGVPVDRSTWAVRAVDAQGNVVASITFGEAADIATSLPIQEI